MDLLTVSVEHMVAFSLALSSYFFQKGGLGPSLRIHNLINVFPNVTKPWI